jgi:integrase/recombinase XerC
MFYQESFFAYLAFERRFAENTLTAYRNDLAAFITYLTERQCLTSVDEVRHLHIRSWIVAQMQGGLSARSINRRLSCLKTYFRFLKRRGHLQADPMRKVVAPKSGRRLPVFVHEPQLATLFSDLPFPDDYRGQSHRLVLEVLYATGMRRSELANLRVADVDLGGATFRITGKGNKQRLAPFARYLIVLLERFLQLRIQQFPASAESRLFLNRHGRPLTPDNIYYIVRKYLSAVTSVEQRSPHVLRHSFATHLSNHGADLNAIKELLGHSNLAATQVYMHNTIDRLKDVYDRAHPKGEKEE